METVRTGGGQPSLLTYTVDPWGTLQVVFAPFGQHGGPVFETATADLMEDARDDLVPIWALNHIAHNCVILGLFVKVAVKPCLRAQYDKGCRHAFCTNSTASPVPWRSKSRGY